jgi:hypothetical protein
MCEPAGSGPTVRGTIEIGRVLANRVSMQLLQAVMSFVSLGFEMSR